MFTSPLLVLRACIGSELLSKGIIGYTAVTSNTTRCMKEGVDRGEYSLIYFTPEMLLEVRKWRELFLKSCFKSRVKALVVDPQDKQRTEGLSAILMLNSLGTSTDR